MIISLIAAVARNGVIGKDNQLPWKISEDLRFFKETTWGHHIILGRKNYQSIGKALPGRVNLVLSRRRDFQAPGCIVLRDLNEALGYARAAGERETFIVGGGQIYAQALSLAQRFYLTLIQRDFDGDVFFPQWDGANRHAPWGREWVEVWREEHPEQGGVPPFTFLRLERRC